MFFRRRRTYKRKDYSFTWVAKIAKIAKIANAHFFRFCSIVPPSRGYPQPRLQVRSHDYKIELKNIIYFLIRPVKSWQASTNLWKCKFSHKKSFEIFFTNLRVVGEWLRANSSRNSLEGPEFKSCLGHVYMVYGLYYWLKQGWAKCGGTSWCQRS